MKTFNLESKLSITQLFFSYNNLKTALDCVVLNNALQILLKHGKKGQTKSAQRMPGGVTMSNDVFISYSRRDEDFIKQLYQKLIDSGISTWYDRKNIEVGNQWAADIVLGIKECKIFVLVVSPDSTASVNVRKEVDLAMRYQKQIVPLIWRPTDIPVAMEYQLAGIQWIEFLTPIGGFAFTFGWLGLMYVGFKR